MQSTTKTVYSPQIAEAALWFSGLPASNLGSCGLIDGNPCGDGCWFYLGSTGCKQNESCAHCHEEVCCILADLKRRDVRKQHSRVRPSKKRREHEKRMRALDLINDETESVSTAGCESSHSVVSTSPTITDKLDKSSVSVPNDIRSIEDLIELIRVAVESDGFQK